MFSPKKRSSNAGVANMPKTLLMTALLRADATFPPDAEVRSIHIFTVVGRHDSINSPSSMDGGSRPGRNDRRMRVRGTPTSAGHAPNMASWTSEFSLKCVTASASSESWRDRPERRNMHVTPNFPINSSGRRTPPFIPT